jgi:general secretion pathway protein D
LFFQKINRRTILVADQNRRAQYQQLSIRTFYLSNIDPTEARTIVAAALPPSQGRPQPNVIADKSTNSITVRDTSENLQLIAELLQSIDKDRAEVVMDVNIYEVSRTDLLQLGNQIGTGDSNGFFSLGSGSGLNILAGARDVATRLSSAPTAFGAALVLPASQLTAFQRKDRTKLVASTQVHAFSGEESTARIGQRVPVQTAQTFPFASTQQPTTPGGVTGGVNFGGGFPVIQYEPTGLTLKFTPQVFPNLDVQVKMSIESKDILNVGSLTPTFTERTITGTARIQNNRTMMLASVAQDTQSNGRRGLPLLGLIPVLGRLFTSPTRNNQQIDIVIAVTPRVLRAPAVTPFDERERPSGTLSSPTTGSLEAMVRETEREEQLAAARRVPTNVVVQLPDAEPLPAYVPAPKSLMTGSEGTLPQPATERATTTAATLTPASAFNLPQPSNVLANALAQLTNEAPPVPAALVDKSTAAAPRTIEVAQPLSATSTPPTATAASSGKEVAPIDSNKNQQSAATSIADKIKTGLLGKPPATPEPAMLTVEARLMTEAQEMRVGERRRVALVLISKEPLGNVIARLRFDPRSLAVRGISQGARTDSTQQGQQPLLMQSIDPAGLVTLAISPQAGAALKSGANVVLYLEVEALAAGESSISFDEHTQVVAADGRSVKLQMVESRLTVK